MIVNVMINKIENNFNKEVDEMKNTIIEEMNLKLNYENGNEMIENLSKEMEDNKMTKLGLYESRTFGRISYGFVRDDKGMVYIKEDEAEIIRWMYKMCIKGLSLLQIQAELIRMGINSPTGKEEWSVVTISKTIDNKNNCYIVSDEDYRIAIKEKMFRARNDRRRW
jgi:hypothetical protein